MYERIYAIDIRPGDYVARARTHPFVQIIEARIGPKAVSLYTDKPGVYARPQHHQLWWKEVQD